MSQQEKVRPSRESRDTSEIPVEAKSDTTKSDKLKADLDAIIDEIDEALEANEGELVELAQNFRQKGGQAVDVVLRWLGIFHTPSIRLL